MEGNWLVINGIKVAVKGTISMEYSSPLSDKTYVYFFGSKLPTRGESSYPFDLTLSPEDLALMGYPHLLQNATANNMRITNVLLYNNGVQRFTGTLILTSISVDGETGYVTAEALLYDQVTDFVNYISNNAVNTLRMDGVRVIDDSVNQLTGAIKPAPSTQINSKVGVTISYPQAGVAGGGIEIQCQEVSIDLRGSATADYAANLTLNGDPNKDENGDYICFPTVFCPDKDNGDTWLNFWDSTVDLGGTARNYYPCFGYTIDNSTGVDIYASYQVADWGNHLTPMYYYHQVIRHCIEEFGNGYTLVDASGLLSDPHFKRKVIVNNFDILNALTLIYANQDGSHIRTVGYWQAFTVIDPRNHLPTDSIQEFLLDFMVKFNCYFDFGTNGIVTLRQGDFGTVDRELKDINPKYVIENTIDTGVTIGYDLPDDKQYDSIKKVQSMTSYLGTEKVFAAGFNKMYPSPTRDTLPVPVPPDKYFGVLFLDCNQLEFVIGGTPGNPFGSPLIVWPQKFYIDNLIPVTIGVDTRPDSPSVNLKEANQDNTDIFNLKYPPVSQTNYDDPTPYKTVLYNMTGWGIETTATTSIHPTVTGAGGVWVAGGVVILAVGTNLVIPVDAIVMVNAIIPNSPNIVGGFNAYGYVQSYNTTTGYLTMEVISMQAAPPSGTFDAGWTVQSDGYFASNNGTVFNWNDWAVTVSQTIDQPPMFVPIVQSPVVAYPTQAFTITPVLGYAYTHDLFQHNWAFKPLITGSDNWSLIPTGQYMPYDWSNRSNSSPVFEMGFFWGLQNMYKYGLSESGIGRNMPVLTGYEHIYGNTDVAPGWFNLSLHGPYSLPAQFWKGFINQYIYNRKVTVQVYETMAETMQHKFNNAVVMRGTKLYITQIRSVLKDRYDGAEYVGFLI